MERTVELGTLITPAKTVRCGNGTYPVLSMTMHNGLVFQDEKFKKVIASKDTSDYKVVYRNQLVISFPIDEGVLAAQRIADAGIVSPAYGIWDIDQCQILPEFLEYALRCNRALQYYKAKLRGSTARRRSLPTPTLLAFTIPLPSIVEQEEILVKIHKAKTLVEKREAQIRMLDELIKARFVEMFGDCAEAVSAGEIMNEMRNGVSPSTSGKCPEKVLTLSAITQGRFDPSMWKDGLFDNPPPAEKRIHATDFYMCRGNGNKSLVGAGVYSKEDREDLVFPDTVIAARVDITRVCLPYLLIAWMQPSVRSQIEAGARTTNGTYKINQQIISKINIPLPSLNAQEQFAAFVAQVDKSKITVKKALDEAQLLFDSMMQLYFG